MPKYSDTLPTFDPGNHEDWIARVDAALKGKPRDRVLQYPLEAGLSANALEDAAGRATFDRPARTRQGWAIQVDLGAVKGRAALDAALLQASLGADQIRSQCDTEGLKALLTAQIEDRLAARLCVDIDGTAQAYRDIVTDVLAAKVVGPEAINLCLRFDPIGAAARGQGTAEHANTAIKDAADATAADLVAFDAVPGFLASSQPFHLAGAPASLEIAALLSAGLTYLRALEASGLSMERAARQIMFEMVASTDMFATTAKFRALRRLWSEILVSCGVDRGPVNLGGVSALRGHSQLDVDVNFLRSVASAFGAGIGGADWIELVPHDAVMGQPSENARRMARNAQHILRSESHLGWVDDPAAGSYALDTMSDSLADAAWAHLQSLEKQGGLLAAIDSGFLAGLCRDASAAHFESLASRRAVLTGASAFPNLDEPALPNADLMEGMGYTDDAPLKPAFDAALFERYRRKSDAYMARHGVRPEISIRIHGAVAAVRPRLAWAQEVLAVLGFQNRVERTDDQPAAVVLHCAPDDGYAAEQLHGGGPHFVLGQPTDLRALEACGTVISLRTGADLQPVFAALYAALEGQQ